MENILSKAIEVKASDIHIVVGLPITYRIDGVLTNIDSAPMEESQVQKFVDMISKPSDLEKLNKQGGADFSYISKEGIAFRASIFRQQGYPSCVLRLIPTQIINLEKIGLNKEVENLLNQPRGLILITGPTGSGKSTTLAAMIDYINRNRKCNIITIEDPIEYRHSHKQSIVVQREVGQDVATFNEAIVKALRQDPDVILIGEMRDFDTIAAALRAAETGHLVISTLHTNGASRTIDRIVDIFPTNSRDQIRIQLAGVLLSVISQQLLPIKNSTGRKAAFEIMFNNTSIASYIRENKSFRIDSDIQTGSKKGMVSMDGSLLKLYLNHEIDYQMMIDRCYDENLLNKLLGEVAGKR